MTRRAGPRAARRTRPPLEREIQRQIVSYLKARGFAVWQTSQGHKHPTGAKGLRITPGIPDLYAFHPRHGALWIECKRPGEERTQAQEAFARIHSEGDVLAPTPAVLLAFALDDVRAFLEPRRAGAILPPPAPSAAEALEDADEGDL